MEAESPAMEDVVVAARRRDFARQQLRLIELEVLETAADELRADYAAKREQTIEAFAATSGAVILPPPSTSSTPGRPWYAFVKADRVHPLHVVRDGSLHRDTEHVGWLLYDNGQQMRAFPQAGRGWSAESAATPLRARAETAAALGWDLVLLVSPDSFARARGLLRELREAGVRASWRPAPPGDHVNLAVADAPP